MRRVGLGALALLLSLPAVAQTPRAQCGYGEALAALARAEREGVRPPEGLAEGRARAQSLLAGLRGAAETLRGCGCAVAAELAAEAAETLAPAPAAPDAARAGAALERGAARAAVARARLGARGCG